MAELLHKISPTARRVIVVHDFLMAYVVQEYQMLKPTLSTPVARSLTSEILNFITLQSDFQKFTSGTGMNSCRTIKGNVKRAKALPQCYEEKVKGIGLLVRDWAPQVEILAHPSTGWFISHCRWNSCLESITPGVPIAAWPMHSDQPKNAFLVTEILKAGLVAKQWEANQKEIVASSAMARVVKRLIASREGEEMRKKAEELVGDAWQAMDKGGISRMEFGFIHFSHN
ncbi:zeatin O-glucosyltransferase-like [Camellia sinensis]|uniref:zeatin O-glucosyltransferase-like n=1 Tax=Camellia sinensis TaxID=4442 RepID=UPI001035CB8C|nr:zeatin O-glucosyltransferase-like [Camellia sinensis]